MEKWNKLLEDNFYVDFVVNQNAYFLDLVSSLLGLLLEITAYPFMMPSFVY